MEKQLFIFLLMLSLNGFAQENFKWKKMDTIPKNPSEIYAITRVFIHQYWKTDEIEIVNEDKAAGAIFLKGTIVERTKFLMGTYTYYYQYNVNFQVMDSTFQITIDQVNCIKATYKGADGFIKDTKKVAPFASENCPESGTITNPGPPQKKLIIMMGNVKNSLQSIVDDYCQNMVKTIPKKSTW